ncbi:uncharacterized protein TNCV_99411 [Trichonephila clavipes]|nr:uncharacterized protein TNCV_99411 [Trichonephila clavipes]
MTKHRTIVHVKEMLLRRLKLSAEKFRLLFRQHKKVQEGAWRDYYFEIKSYFEGCLDELKIANFNRLKDLIIFDQIKRRVPPEVRDHFVDDWSGWVSPSELADKLDVYCNIRNATTLVKKIAHLREYPSKSYAPKRNSHDCRFNRFNQAGSTSSFNSSEKLKTGEKSGRPPISCYGCSKIGVTKPRCPNCKPIVNRDSANFGNISLHSCSSTPNQTAVLRLAVNGIWGMSQLWS